ncbi:AP1-like transcription factor-like protein [Cucurbitaria berberidis CBS 394.84]|uniref:AP1-like transcription factor-like protein n=1 Tax=Cucurbitaria berberidis CBS 394.84 TaxID=1168544 RepID=A0A9P4L8B2_9PLEO|nr:AP1-like transcription factor-like protein [Cucurbitaria berberidis CBS 394.84]KAF1845078.1 AP1-like transcription factor-like protein [Cucurbitaria berberidis CBS 394.84]
MAGTTNDFQNGAPFYLDATQQDLLLAALASNNQNPSDIFSSGIDNATKGSLSNSQFPYPANSLDPTYFTSPQQSTPANGFDNLGMEESPFVDYIDGDNSFDFDNADNGDIMIGALPGDSPDGNEKRKSPDDEDEDEDEGGGKRTREGDDKQAKKPGRKPLTSEPTTKRKAQNRAAQRAFRERKEKHLKDLETKVQELEKASDATNHENGLLRAQVQRLQMELREYRKRLSLNSTGLNRAPPPAAGFSSLLNNNSSNFSFDFPRFGGLPGAQFLDNGVAAKNKTATRSPSVSGRQNSTGGAISPVNQANSSITASPSNTGTSPTLNGAQRSASLNGFFSPNSTATNNVSRGSTDSASTAQSRVFQFNSGSSTHSESASSSTSPNAQDSSCSTSPEPSHTSPGQLRDTIADGYICTGNSEGEVTFCEKLNMACGNPRNPVPRAMSKSDDKPPAVINLTTSPTPAPALNGIDYLANQNGGQFDPTLFGEYRDTQNAIVGDGDFTGGFFNDAFLNAGYGSPFHFGDTPAVQKPNPLEEIERIQDGEDEVVPGEDINSMLNCHKIWDKLSSRPDFKDGTIDIDNLCSELRAKARCSESGVVVDHKDVEAALKRLPQDKLPI